jgi:hypothetical protein
MDDMRNASLFNLHVAGSYPESAHFDIRTQEKVDMSELEKWVRAVFAGVTWQAVPIETERTEHFQCRLQVTGWDESHYFFPLY